MSRAGRNRAGLNTKCDRAGLEAAHCLYPAVSRRRAVRPWKRPDSAHDGLPGPGKPARRGAETVRSARQFLQCR